MQAKYHVFVDRLAVVNYPDDYGSRLIRLYPVWDRVRLWALEPHDLAPTKLERSLPHDIRDLIGLADAGLIDRNTTVARFEGNVAPHYFENVD